MSSYERLAASYDELTEDVDYQRRADFLERLFQRAPAGAHGARPRLRDGDDDVAADRTRL